jgi:hypothetical protein
MSYPGAAMAGCISDGMKEVGKAEICLRVPGAMQRFFSAASQNRDRIKGGVR